MKFFAALAVALLLVLPIARAQENPDDQYVIIYTLIQQGDANLDSGQPQRALDNYREAQTELQKFQQVYSDWNPNIVSFRLNYLAQKIAALTPPTSAAKAPAVTAAPVPADLASQANSLNAQIHQLQADNETLQAKLKEALGAQPASVSPDAFAQLQKQASDLARENDLLKATVAQQATNGTPQLQQALTQQTARATQLAQQNESLQARITVLTTEAGAVEALREENAVLKKEVAGVNPALAGAALTPAAMQQELARLKAENTDDRLETKALENRIQRMEEATVNSATEAGSASAAELQSQIGELTRERDSLRAQLGEANKKGKGSKNASGAALDALALEVERLRARVDVDEAQAVPYTPQELALFQPGSLAGGPDTNETSSHKLSGGTAVLVAEAQNYYTNREYDKAAADYQKILQNDTNNPVALANLASVEVEQNKIPDADKHIQAAIAQTPDDAFALTVLGRVKFAEADYDASLEALERAAKIDPKNAQVENFLGVALAEKGLRTQAETAFRKAIQIEPDYGDAHKNLTIFYLTARPPMVELARWHYEKALAAGVPPSPDLQRMLDQDRASNSQ
jgi:tetratricopeptide (TPR) repeat protein